MLDGRQIERLTDGHTHTTKEINTQTSALGTHESHTHASNLSLRELQYASSTLPNGLIGTPSRGTPGVQHDNMAGTGRPWYLTMPGHVELIPASAAWLAASWLDMLLWANECGNGTTHNDNRICHMQYHVQHYTVWINTQWMRLNAYVITHACTCIYIYTCFSV